MGDGWHLGGYHFIPGKRVLTPGKHGILSADQFLQNKTVKAEFSEGFVAILALDSFSDLNF